MWFELKIAFNTLLQSGLVADNRCNFRSDSLSEACQRREYTVHNRFLS